MPQSNYNMRPLSCQASEEIRREETLTKIKAYKLATRNLSRIMDLAGMHDRAAALYSCGDSVIMRQYADGSQEVAGAMYCRERLCPTCQWRRSLKLYGQLSQVMDAADARAAAAGKKKPEYIMLTLTVLNCPDEELSPVIDKLFAGWARVVRQPEYKAACSGAYRTLEITRSKRGDADIKWHPHMHVLLAVKPQYWGRAYLSQEKWLALWQICAQLPYTPIIDVRKVKCDGGLAEVTKYVCKADWYNASDEEAVHDVTVLQDAMYRRRMVAWYGSLRDLHRGLHLDDEDGDLTQTAPIRPDLAYTLYHYIWQDGVYMRIPMRASTSTMDMHALRTALMRSRDGHYVPEVDDPELLNDINAEIKPRGASNPFHAEYNLKVPHI